MVTRNGTFSELCSLIVGMDIALRVTQQVRWLPTFEKWLVDTEGCPRNYAFPSAIGHLVLGTDNVRSPNSHSDALLVSTLLDKLEQFFAAHAR